MPAHDPDGVAVAEQAVARRGHYTLGALKRAIAAFEENGFADDAIVWAAVRDDGPAAAIAGARPLRGLHLFSTEDRLHAALAPDQQPAGGT